MKKGRKIGGLLSLVLAGASLQGCAMMSMTPSVNTCKQTPSLASLDQAVLAYYQSDEFVFMHEKADYFQEQIEQNHITPEGLLAYKTNLKRSKPGQPFVHSAGDMALHTSLYISSEAFRYNVTKDPGALDNIKRTLHAIRNLMEVTGVDGLFARYYGLPEYTRESEFKGRFIYDGHGRFEGYKWIGDVSNDQMAGLYFAFANLHDLVDDEEVRHEVRHLVTAATDHMIENGMRFRDASGKYTRFTNMSLTGGVDMNKMLGLSFLKTAHHITGDERYDDKYDRLVSLYKYHLRTRVLKPALVTEKLDAENHFNDNVIFLGLYNLLRYEDDEKLLRIYRKAAHHTWYNYSRGEANSFFNIIYNATMPQNEYMEESFLEAFASLILMPMKVVDAFIMNSDRDDICIRKVKDKLLHGEWKACTPLPMNRRPITDFAWQRDPYQLDGGSKNPNRGYSKVDFLLPYWMGRYYGFIDENL